MKLFNKILGALITDDTVICKFSNIPVIITSYYKIFLLSLCIITLLTEGILLASALFAILSMVYFFVVCHEYGHALMAQKFGYEVANISLYPYGGIASVKGDFENNDKHEFWIAVAGPLVNVAFGLLFIPLAIMFAETFAVNHLFLFCLNVNAILLFFNLLPLYPLDGGRICKALIGMNITKKWAMKTTGIITVVTSVFMIPTLWMYEFYVGSIFVAILFFGNLFYLIWGNKMRTGNEFVLMVERDEKPPEEIIMTRKNAEKLVSEIMKSYSYLEEKDTKDLLTMLHCGKWYFDMDNLIIERAENSLDRTSKREQLARFLREIISDDENKVYISHLSNQDVQDHLFVMLGIGLPDNKVVSLWKENISTNILLESA